MEKLRLLAEEQLRAMPTPPVNDRPRLELVHELRVHEIELDMQNDELRRSELELQQSRDRYRDVFQLAPVAYLVLSAEDPVGKILESNHATARLLGVEGENLEGTHLQRFLPQESADALFLHIKSVVNSRSGERLAVDLQLQEPQVGLRMVSVQMHDRLECLSTIYETTLLGPTKTERHLASEDKPEFVSLCAYCKNVKEHPGTWTQIEQWVHARAHVQFSHGICPTCLETQLNGPRR